MKKITNPIACCMLLSITFGQNNEIPKFSQPDFGILYRNHLNIVEIKQGEDDEKNYVVSCESCEVTNENYKGEFLGTNTFYVRLESATLNTITLKIAEKNHPDKIVVTKDFKVLNAPDPYIYLGNESMGNSLHYENQNLIIGYPKDIPLKANHEMKSWEFVVGDTSYKGEGNELTNEAKKALKSMPNNSLITINCVIIDLDGISRMKTVHFNLL